MVVTSRWLGYKAEALRKAEFAHYMLQDLNDEQIEDFLERWHGLTFAKGQQAERERKQGRLQKAIVESKAIRELAGNPLLLTMMAILNRNQELPRDRARLYEEASKVLLYQWDVDVKLHEQEDLKYWQIDVRDKQAMLRKVARHMQVNEEGLSGSVISRDDLEEILTDYLKKRDVDRARPVARVMIKQLRERNFILCYLGADNYAFVHRVFLEYFCASEFVHQFEKEKKFDEEDLKELYGQHFSNEAWKEVLRLIAGMVEPRFVGEIIEYLLDRSVHPSEFFEEGEAGINRLLLASDCLSEVRTCDEVTHISNLLLNKMKQEVNVNYSLIHQLGDESFRGLLMSIAKNWKHKLETKDWLMSWLSVDSYFCLSDLSIQAIAECWKDDPETLILLKVRAQQDKDEYVRLAAVRELAKGWKDDLETLVLLKVLVQRDDSWRVRGAAVQGLAKGWKDEPETLIFLKVRAQQDENEYVRCVAIRELAKGWKDDSEMLSLLKTYAQQVASKHVRYAAVQELSKGWKDEFSLFEFWCDRTLKDPFERKYDFEDNPRQIALNVLVRQYPNYPKTTELLHDRVQNDTDEKLRTWATEQLSRLVPEAS